jgi:hypothetical protein
VLLPQEEAAAQRRQEEERRRQEAHLAELQAQLAAKKQEEARYGRRTWHTVQLSAFVGKGIEMDGWQAVCFACLSMHQ